MYGKVASRWPSILISGIVVPCPYAPRARLWTSRPQRSMTSFALHFKKTSPTNSISEACFASGKCHGELNVSVNARCCSAITLRDIRCLTYQQVRVRASMLRVLTDRSSVFINLSMSSALIRSRHSRTPMASFGITVRCSCKVWLTLVQNRSLSSSVLISWTRRRVSNAL